MIKRLILILFLIPNFTNAAVIINEIMYDLEGSDTGREWIEVFNNGSDSQDLAKWKLYEAQTNHGLSIIKGESIIPPSGYAIIADNSEKFLTDWPNFSGILFDSSFSLNNTGETLTLRNADLVDIDTATYTSDMGANGDGKSLQKINGVWVAANPTPGTVNSGQQSQQQISSSTPSAPEPTTESTSYVDSVRWPVEPQIFANAGQDKTVIVGADVYFSGQALGLKKEPLEGVRFLWNFGDGAFKEGQNISHVYKYPGEYIVALNVSSGKYSASDYALVKAVPSQIKISEANKNFIKLSNESNVTLDISGWFLRIGDKTFKFPESTLIKANSTLIIPSSNSELEANNNVELLYPNGSLANSYTKSRETTIIVDSKEKEIIKEEIIENTSTPQSQTAGVITIEKSDFWTAKKWWGLIILIGILSGIGFLFIHKKGPPSGRPEGGPWEKL